MPPMIIDVPLLLGDEAQVPYQAHTTDGAYDLYAVRDSVIFPYRVAAVKTHLSMAIPAGFRGRILGRSGLAFQGIQPFGGVLDSGYTGEVFIALFNGTPEAWSITAGERVAQFVIEQVITVNWVLVDSLPETERGGNGLGSTGR